MASQYGQMFLEAARRTQEQNEANARSRTFDVGKVIPALITSIATANPTPLLLAGTGEATRAATGSSTDIAGLAQMTGQQYMPQQSNDTPVSSLHETVAQKVVNYRLNIVSVNVRQCSRLERDVDVQ